MSGTQPTSGELRTREAVVDWGAVRSATLQRLDAIRRIAGKRGDSRAVEELEEVIERCRALLQQAAA